jgi:hypothetical protein
MTSHTIFAVLAFAARHSPVGPRCHSLLRARSVETGRRLQRVRAQPAARPRPHSTTGDPRGPNPAMARTRSRTSATPRRTTGSAVLRPCPTRSFFRAAASVCCRPRPHPQASSYSAQGVDFNGDMPTPSSLGVARDPGGIARDRYVLAPTRWNRVAATVKPGHASVG